MSDIQEQINILIEVEGVEVEIIQTDRHIDALSSEAASLDRTVEDCEAGVAAEKGALAEIKKDYRELESEARINADMIAKSNAKLREVKTNKEYQSILKEIEDIKKRNSSIEDRMLEQLEAIETAEASVKAKETELAEIVESCRRKKEALDAEAQRQRQTIETLMVKKEAIGAKADPTIISVLTDVKRKVRGRAVVPAQQAICMGCHMNIPAQLFNELQRFDEIRFCPHCHRIIYWKEKDSE